MPLFVIFRLYSRYNAFHSRYYAFDVIYFSWIDTYMISFEPVSRTWVVNRVRTSFKAGYGFFLVYCLNDPIFTTLPSNFL